MKLTEIHEPKENKMGPQDYKIFVDIDGVLADFVAGIKNIIPDYDEEQYTNDPKYRTKTWKVINKYTDEGGKLWGELPLMDDAKELWNFVKPYDPEILSATGKLAHSVAGQKRKWIADHFGSDVVVNLVQDSKDKAKFLQENKDKFEEGTCILIDDRLDKSIKPWVAAGGIGIHHTSAAKSISELKKLGF